MSENNENIERLSEVKDLIIETYALNEQKTKELNEMIEEIIEAFKKPDQSNWHEFAITKIETYAFDLAGTVTAFEQQEIMNTLSTAVLRIKTTNSK